LPTSPSGSRINLERAAETAGLKIAPELEVDSIALTKQLVSRGGAFTILPARALRDEIDAGHLASAPIVDPTLSQPVYWAVKPDWRLPRPVYNELERIVIEEWYASVTTGEWPAEGVFDFSLLSIPFAGKVQP